MYMRSDVRGAGEWASVFGGLGQMPTVQLTELPLSQLDPWVSSDGRPQPFDAYSPEELFKLSENIRQNGIIEPICVRMKQNGRFEILAGHNRCNAAKLAGLTKVPAQIRNLDDSEAADMLVDSNLNRRKEIKPSERARAYKLLLDNMKHQGKASDQSEQKSSRQLLAEKVNDSPANVQRYIRLTNLNKYFLDLLDAHKLTMIVANELSFLSNEELELLVNFPVPKKPQAVELREASHDAPLTLERIAEIMEAEPVAKEKPLKISAEAIRAFFPEDTTAEQMENEILIALEFYRARKSNVADE